MTGRERRREGQPWYGPLLLLVAIALLSHIYATTQRDGVDFNLAFIPASFNVPLKEPFEQRYMDELFKLGYQLGRSGYDWVTGPARVLARPTRLTTLGSDVQSVALHLPARSVVEQRRIVHVELRAIPDIRHGCFGTPCPGCTGVWGRVPQGEGAG
jgi:hypothetical protein